MKPAVTQRGEHAIFTDVPAETATLVTDLLVAERLRCGTPVGSRAASCRDQAILVLRWFREDTAMRVLALDAGVSLATGYRYLHEGIDEGIDVLAAQAPDLHQVLEGGAAAGCTHVTLDGTLIRTDRDRTPTPPPVTTCGSPASTKRTVATCRSSPTPTGSRSRSPTCNPARSTT